MPTIWYRGVAYFSKGEFELALNDFNKAFDLHPNNPHVLNNLGTIQEYYNRHNKAIEYYNQAIIVAHKFQDAIINLSAVYYNIGDYLKAYNLLSRKNINFTDERYKIYLKKIKEKL